MAEEVCKEDLSGLLVCPTLKPHEAWKKQGEDFCNISTEDSTKLPMTKDTAIEVKLTRLFARSRGREMLFMQHTWEIWIP
jgi:hypothetical protein